MRRKVRTFSDEAKREILAAAEKLGVASASAKYRVHKSVVYGWKKRFGSFSPAPPRPKAEREAEREQVTEELLVALCGDLKQARDRAQAALEEAEMDLTAATRLLVNLRRTKG